MILSLQNRAAMLVLLAASIGQAETPVLATEAAPLHASVAGDLNTDLDRGDVESVRQIADDRHVSRAEAEVAKAALVYWFRDDDKASQRLKRVVQNSLLSPGSMQRALVMLSGLRERQGRYKDAAKALELALPLVSDEKRREELQYQRDAYSALALVPAMKMRSPRTGRVALTRDIAGLNRGPVTVNGRVLDAIVDTGSSICSITEAEALRLALHILPGQISTATSTAARALTGIAYADSIEFGGATIHNVVFLVFPDSAFSFANGKYVIQAIVGMPVLLQLGRIVYVTDGKTDVLEYDRAKARVAPTPNLMLDGFEPFLLAPADGQRRPLRLFVDNGATRGHLNQRFAKDFPEFMQLARHKSSAFTGAAGSETQDVLEIPNLSLRLGDTPINLKAVEVIDDHHSDRDGSLGLDAFRLAKSYVLDFNRMRFDLIPLADAQTSSPVAP